MNSGTKLLIVLLSFVSGISGIQILTATNLWSKTACIAENIKAYEHYICDKFGKMKCLPGYTNEYNNCRDPICSPACVPGQGNCSLPNVCSCEIGWTGKDCSMCIPVPGCLNGNCTLPFQCNCQPGWTGLLCDKPVCNEGCIHGHCSFPGECHCHPGWTGPNCTQCIKLPGCSQHGTCTRPLECKCSPGWTGHFCETPICRNSCNATYGFCRRPNECWCRTGWTGPTCSTCMPYPGCENGTCSKPWECNCNPGYVGKLCNRLDTDPTTTPVPYDTTSVLSGDAFPADAIAGFRGTNLLNRPSLQRNATQRRLPDSDASNQA